MNLMRSEKYLQLVLRNLLTFCSCVFLKVLLAIIGTGFGEAEHTEIPESKHVEIS